MNQSSSDEYTEYKSGLKEYLLKLGGNDEFFKAVILGIDFDDDSEVVEESEPKPAPPKKVGGKKEKSTEDTNTTVVVDALEDEDPYENVEGFYE